MVSLLTPALHVSETESNALQALIWVALFHFIVSTISIVWNSIPAIPWYWFPAEANQIDIGDDIGELLPSEKENRTGKPGHFETLATFRNDEEFCLKDALEQYHENPIPYANALAEVGKEICEVTYQKDSTEYRALRAKDRVRRQRYYHMIEGVDRTFTFMSLREWFMPWQAVRLFDTPNQIFRDYVNAIGMKILGFVGLIDALETTNTSNTVRWIEEFEKFRKNVNRLCRDIGCEVEDFPTLQETIQRLKRYASEETQKMSPLWEENARLKRKLEAQKRIIAAVQIRCTIENLVHAIPNKGKYDDRAAGNK